MFKPLAFSTLPHPTFPLLHLGMGMGGPGMAGMVQPGMGGPQGMVGGMGPPGMMGGQGMHPGMGSMGSPNPQGNHQGGPQVCLASHYALLAKCVHVPLTNRRYV